jgi:hypothetical protein
VCKAVQDVRPGDVYKNVFDGQAVCAIVLAFSLLESQEARDARAAAEGEDEAHVECAGGCTDAMPVKDSPDSVQLALLDFLKGSDVAECEAALAISAYGRAESYGSASELLGLCAAFLLECKELLLADKKTTLPDKVTQQEVVKTREPPPKTASPQASLPPAPPVSEYTAAFYASAETPFAFQERSVGGLTAAPAQPPPPEEPEAKPCLQAAVDFDLEDALLHKPVNDEHLVLLARSLRI